MQLKTSIVTLFLLITFFAQAQRWNLQHKASVDFLLGYDYSIRMLNEDVVEDVAIQILANRKRNENPKDAIRIGFNFNYNLTEDLYFKTGLRYTNPGFKTSPIVLFDPEVDDINTFTKTSITRLDSIGNSLKYNYNFIEIPLVIRYVYSVQFCRAYIEGGFSGNLYSASRIKREFIDGRIVRTNIKEDIKTFNLAAHFSVGADLLVEDDYSIFLQFNTKLFFNDIRNVPIEERMVSIGFATGFRYNL